MAQCNYFADFQVVNTLVKNLQMIFRRIGQFLVHPCFGSADVEGGKRTTIHGPHPCTKTGKYVSIPNTLQVLPRFRHLLCLCILSFNFFVDHSLGSTNTLFRTSGDISSGFQSPSGQPYSHLAEVYVLLIP